MQGDLSKSICYFFWDYKKDPYPDLFQTRKKISFVGPSDILFDRGLTYGNIENGVLA